MDEDGFAFRTVLKEFPCSCKISDSVFDRLQRVVSITVRKGKLMTETVK